MKRMEDNGKLRLPRHECVGKSPGKVKFAINFCLADDKRLFSTIGLVHFCGKDGNRSRRFALSAVGEEL